MKMKYIIASVLFVSVFYVTGVSVIANNNLRSFAPNENRTEVISMKNESVDNLINRLAGTVTKTIGNNYSTNATIKKVYSAVDLRFLQINPVGEIYQVSVAPRTLGQVNEMYPFEFLERVNEHLIYAVYKIQEGELDYYMYLFFTKVNAEESTTLNDYDSWVLDGRSFTISRSLEYVDFTGIEIGSTISQVAEIDPLAMQRKPLNYIGERTHEWFDVSLKEYVEDIISPPATIEYDDYYYLKDGILVISFGKLNDPNVEFTVTKIVFDSEFKITLNSSPYTSRSLTPEIPFKIFDKDFPVGTIVLS